MAWLGRYVEKDPTFSHLLKRGRTQGNGFLVRDALSAAASAKNVSVAGNMNFVGIPDAGNLRYWKKSNGFIKSAVGYRRSQVSTAPWDVIVTTPGLSKADQTEAEACCQRAKDLFCAPNPSGKNNSFQGLVEPIVDDLLVISQAGLVKTTNKRGEVKAIEHVDGALVKTVKGWRRPSDGPRYILINPDLQSGKLLTNDQMVLMIYEPNTYDEVGEPPLRALQDKLRQMLDAFNSAAEMQRNRAPSTLINFSGMDDSGLERMKRLIQNELLGVSTVGVMNYPLDGVDVMNLSSLNLQEQGVAWFIDVIVREICAVFQVPTTALAWDQDVNRATGNVQLRMSLDVGVIPLMKLIQGYLNREIVATFGNPNIAFVWTELLSTDSPVDATILAKQAGPIIYMSINELRVAAGMHEIKCSESDPRWPWLNEPFVPVGTGALAPVSIAAGMAEYQPEVQAALGQAQIQGVQSQQQGQQDPKKTLALMHQLRQERALLQAELAARKAGERDGSRILAATKLLDRRYDDMIGSVLQQVA